MKISVKKIAWWIGAIVFCKLFAYFIHWYKVEYQYEIVEAGYYKFSALHDLLAASLVFYLVKEKIPLRIIGFWWVMLAVNQMLDELFFDATKFQINELLFGTVVLFYSIYNLSIVCRKE